jgi:hypothetical protein
MLNFLTELFDYPRKLSIEKGKNDHKKKRQQKGTDNYFLRNGHRMPLGKTP